jgi:hypothetical protein
MTLYHSSQRLLQVAVSAMIAYVYLSIMTVLTLAKQSPQESALRVENKTKSFPVVNIDKDTQYIQGMEFIRVSLRNDYEKTITSSQTHRI